MIRVTILESDHTFGLLVGMTKKCISIKPLVIVTSTEFGPCGPHNYAQQRKEIMEASF
jgi:hypothetical protein